MKTTYTRILLVMISGLVLILLWQLLLPGYVLTLDMVFVPHVPPATIKLGGYWNAALFRLPMYLLGLLIPGWLVQKFMFLVLFIALPLHGYRYLLPSSTQARTRAFVALFYTFNPFVYTRFLAGQWTILIAYSFLPIVYYFATKTGQGDRKSAVLLGLTLVLTFAFSLHLGVVALFVWLFALLGAMSPRLLRAWIGNLVAGAILLVGTLYWTIPAFFRKGNSLLEIINDRHIEAFKTVSDPLIGTLGNVLALYGFWGEHEPWAQQFIWAKQAAPIWIVSGLVLAVMIMLGVVKLLRERTTRRVALAMLGLGFVAVVFACGVGDTPFRSFNEWLFAHLEFWKGFRDSQKWSAVLVMVYAFFAGHGLEGRYTNQKTILASGAVLLYTFPMLFGFSNQLKPVWYPESWTQVNDILKQDKDCKAIFLPWHSYFSLKFNHNLLTANPAKDFFSCNMIVSRQVELGEIGQQGQLDPAYDAIEGLVTGKDRLSTNDAFAVLQSAHIHYIILTDDLEGQDQWNYDFLQNSALQKTDFQGMKFYRVAE